FDANAESILVFPLCLPSNKTAWKAKGRERWGQCPLRTVPRVFQKLFVPSVPNLKSARTLALDDDVAVQRAQFDLSNVTARCFWCPVMLAGLFGTGVISGSPRVGGVI